MKMTPRIRRSLPILSGAFLLSLAACNSQPDNIVVGPPDDMKEQLAAAKPVSLPPSIAAAESFRCKDNSTAFVDFYSDNKSAGIHKKHGDAPTIVKSETPGGEMTADGGYSLTGTAKSTTIMLAVPGKPKQECDA